MTFLTKSNKLLILSKLNFFRTMSKKAIVLLADGAEEMEVVIAVDVLRRGGVDVTIAGLPDAKLKKCSRNVNIQPDVSISELGPELGDVIVMPGGLGGSKALVASAEVGKLLKQYESNGKLIAAICAAPTALKAHGIATGKNLTSYPAFEQEFAAGGQYNFKQDNVVIDGNLVTSRGPGTAFEFGLTLVEMLVGKEKRAEVAKGMLLN